jgi:hypothetical protein
MTVMDDRVHKHIPIAFGMCLTFFLGVVSYLDIVLLFNVDDYLALFVVGVFWNWLCYKIVDPNLKD